MILAQYRTSLLLPLALAGAVSRQTRDPLLYCSNEVSNTISVISPKTNTVIATIPVGKRPRGMALSPDRRTVYVALGQDDAIGVIDVTKAAMSRTMRAGRDPELVAESPDGKTLYVS